MFGPKTPRVVGRDRVAGGHICRNRLPRPLPLRPPQLVVSARSSFENDNDVKKTDKKTPSCSPPHPHAIPTFSLDFLIEFGDWLQSESSAVHYNRMREVDAAKSAIHNLVKQEKNTFIRIIREIRERIQKGECEDQDQDQDDDHK